MPIGSRIIVLILLSHGLLIANSTGQVPSNSRMRYLENDEIRLGADLNRGGAIVFFSRRGGENMINNFDRGRQVQLSFFSGPIPFVEGEKKPSSHWRHLGWNPIQAGDDFGNQSRILKHTNDGKVMYTKLEPLQWPLNDVPGDCIFETWIELEGSAAKVRAKLKNRRRDKKLYPARLQELPALYGNAKYHQVVSYCGDEPFTDGILTEAPKPSGKHPWSFWQGTECWSAVVDDRGRGLGLITPNRTFFTGGFAGKPGPNDTSANSCSYLAGQGIEVLDHDIEYEFRFELVAGTIEEIRNHAKKVRPRELPTWSFANDRQGWHMINARDQGWPIRDGLRLSLSMADPQLISPFTFWRAEDAPKLEITCSLKTNDKFATVYWQSHGKNGFDSRNVLQFPIIGDGKQRRYSVQLSESPNYQGGIIRLRLDPANGGDNQLATIQSIKLMGKSNDQ